jgi:hypothetical protein
MWGAVKIWNVFRIKDAHDQGVSSMKGHDMETRSPSSVIQS